ncbi:hypothetical protein AVEN_222033-1 [Araneus ventricosus]|uniref:Histone-lysine N-methyltransferase SETMAR n=1 Tax=Araneus ventricosus TaxID=182803 RepID=A0A4Y2JR09_ARAVE|nr:hypothetical protein AVEN_222033-1 [Araneus ventricosus]
MAGRIYAPAKCELRNVIRFIQAEVVLWKMINAAISCHTSRQLRRAILTSGVVFNRDNIRHHSAAVTQQVLEQFEWEVSDHSVYSPDLATSDFHFFPELKNWLGG